MNNPRQTEADAHEAIETLYSTFASYALRPHVDGCPCCVTSDLQNQIRSRTLRNLSPQELEEFGRKAMTTWGEVEDFKHFLPRLFEIQTFSPDWLTDAEVLFGKLDYAHWHTWPAEEQAAIRNFLQRFWAYSLTTTGGLSNIEERLCSIALAGEDMTPFLSHWAENLAPIAVRHLADLVYDNAHQLTAKGKLSNAFWDGHDKEMKQVTAWLALPATAEAFEKAVFNEKLSETDSAEMESALMFFATVKAVTK